MEVSTPPRVLLENDMAMIWTFDNKSGSWLESKWLYIRMDPAKRHWPSLELGELRGGLGPICDGKASARRPKSGNN